MWVIGIKLYSALKAIAAYNKTKNRTQRYKNVYTTIKCFQTTHLNCLLHNIAEIRQSLERRRE